MYSDFSAEVMTETGMGVFIVCIVVSRCRRQLSLRITNPRRSAIRAVLRDVATCPGGGFRAATRRRESFQKLESLQYLRVCLTWFDERAEPIIHFFA